jgi:hypothetical protein
MCFWILILFALGFQNLQGQEITVPVSLQIELLIRILAFERTHLDSGDQKTHIAIVYQSNFRKSNNARSEILSTLAITGKNQVVVKEIDLDQNSFEEVLIQQKSRVILVCPLRSYPIEKITSLSRKQGILTATIVAEYVRKGITIGIEVERDRPHILINMGAARLEQANFDSRLLSIARLVE